MFLIGRITKQKLLRRFVWIAICLTTGACFLNWSNSSGGIEKCFADLDVASTKGLLLQDALLSSKKPIPGKSIFFHETSCKSNPEVQLSPREACAIESAANLNPNQEVFVLFAFPKILLNNSLPPIIDAILSYPNVNLRNVNLWAYANGSPVSNWLQEGELFESRYLTSHLSDFLRYLTLWKWGGTYLDLDVIVKHSFENIPQNFAGAESEKFVAAGVLNFDYNGFGHQIADLCLRNFQINFDGSDWGNNGPGVITRVLQEVCKTKSPQEMLPPRCLGFRVFPQKAFYAVRWWNWNNFFDKHHLEETLKLTNESIVVHVWNKHSVKKVISVRANTAYTKLAEQFCPRVYKSCGDYF